MSRKSSRNSSGCSGSLTRLHQNVNWSCRCLKAGLGEDPLPSSFLWIRSLLDVGWSHWFFVMRSFHRTDHNVSASFSQSERRSEQDGSHNILMIWTWKTHLITSVVFYALEVSHHVLPTSKMRRLHRAWISGGGDDVSHAGGCLSHTGSRINAVSSFTYPCVNTQPPVPLFLIPPFEGTLYFLWVQVACSCPTHVLLITFFFIFIFNVFIKSWRSAVYKDTEVDEVCSTTWELTTLRTVRV